MNGEKQILVTRSSMPSLSEYIQEISSLWESHWLTNMGIKHKRLEEELLKYLDVDNIELVSNGHMALELISQKTSPVKASINCLTSPTMIRE